MKQLSKWVRNAFKEAVFPKKCLSCGSLYRPEPKPTRKTNVPDRPAPGIYGNIKKIAFFDLMANFLCQSCAKAYLPVTSPLCSCCGMMFKSREGEDHLCGDCISSPKRFRTARAAGVYDRTLMKAIHALKYRGKIQLANPFGVLLLRAFYTYWDPSAIDMIVPVPLHVKRFRSRGFNQSFILIKDWAGISENLAPDISHIHIDRDNLVRSGRTRPQTGLGKRERKANIRNAFAIKDPERVRDKHVLLVDDVYTTGATVNECSKILLTSGAKCVDVLTLARAT
jgi:ComF family protein